MGLWVVCWWNWCGEPSQALRASSPGGRAKGSVGIGGRWESQGLGGYRWSEGEPRARWASVAGGRAKGSVGIGGRRESQGFLGESGF